MPCANCHCDRCEIPAGAEVLARSTAECCFVYRDAAGHVVKALRERVPAAAIAARAAIAAEHPDLFAPIDYDAATHSIRQPFVHGRRATFAEIAALERTLFARGQVRVRDLTSPGNVLVDEHGTLKIVDFQLASDGIAHRAAFAARRRRVP